MSRRKARLMECGVKRIAKADDAHALLTALDADAHVRADGRGGDGEGGSKREARERQERGSACSRGAGCSRQTHQAPKADHTLKQKMGFVFLMSGS